MREDLEYLSDLVLLSLSVEERKEVLKRLKALRTFLKRLEKVKTGEEAPFLPSLRLKMRSDEPKLVEEVLRVIPNLKDRYVKGPKTV